MSFSKPKHVAKSPAHLSQSVSIQAFSRIDTQTFCSQMMPTVSIQRKSCIDTEPLKLLLACLLVLDWAPPVPSMPNVMCPLYVLLRPVSYKTNTTIPKHKTTPHQVENGINRASNALIRPTQALISMTLRAYHTPQLERCQSLGTNEIKPKTRNQKTPTGVRWL